MEELNITSTEEALKVLIEEGYTLNHLLAIETDSEEGLDCIAAHVDENGDMDEDERDAMEMLGITPRLCGCLSCGCQRVAVTTDDGGTPVCMECATFTVIDGNVVCARIGLGRKCHICHEIISWGPIVSGNPGEANYRAGECACGMVWRDEDLGGWGHYTYLPTDEEE